MPTWCRALALTSIGAFALVMITIYNGYPFFFFDTHTYYTGGQKTVDTIVALACGVHLGCLHSLTSHGVQNHVLSSLVAEAHSASKPGTIDTGRSPFYGVLFYLCDRLTSIWMLVVGQAFAASWLLYLGVRCLAADNRPAIFLCAIAVVAGLTSLPLFVGYLMPDVFAGLYILAIALLIVFYETLMPTELTALWVLLVFSMLSHPSHVLGGGILLGFIVLFVLAFARNNLQRVTPALLLTGAAIAIGAAGFVMVNFMVSRITGLVATPPPILLARVIQDGSGSSYLRQACSDEHYTVCRFVHRMPMNTNDFLWSRDPEKGVWSVVSPEERVQIAQEQYPIVLRSFLYAPIMQIKSSARNVGQQIVTFDVTEFKVDEELKNFIVKEFGGDIAEKFLKTRIAGNQLNLTALSILYRLAICASFLLLVFRFPRLEANTKAALVIVLTGVIMNAVVTGSISEPDNRYESRVIWLIPYFAAVIELGKRDQGGREPTPV